MRYSIVVAAIIPFVAAHGKIAMMTAGGGGNTTGLGIQGGVIPGAGTNKETEVDTTVFNSRKAATDGLGKTKAGPNTMANMKSVMEQSGSTLPQVTDDGMLEATMHIVTTDGAGPFTCIIDTGATGAFSQGTEAKVVTQVPGRRGNIAAPKQRSLVMRSLVKMGIVKRAKNVNEDYPLKMQIPPGTKCTGSVGGQENVCLVKIANPNGAGPFGGVAAFQIADSAAPATPAGSPPNNEPSAVADKNVETPATAKGTDTGPGAKPARSIGAKFRA